MVALFAAALAGSSFTIGGWSAVDAGPYPSAAVSRDGRIVVYRGESKAEIRRDGKAVRTFPCAAHAFGGAACGLSDDGRLLAYEGPDGLRVEETLSGKRLAQADLRAMPGNRRSGPTVEALAFAPDGKTIATAYGGLYHHWVAFVDLPSGTVRPTVLVDFDGGSSQLLWSPDGNLLAGGDGVGFVLRRDGEAALRPCLKLEALQGGDRTVDDPAVRSVDAHGAFFRKGRPYAVDPRGVFPLDAKAWPSPWKGDPDVPLVVAPDGSWGARSIPGKAVEIFRPVERAFVPNAKPDLRFETTSPFRPLVSGGGRWLLLPRGTGFYAIDLRRS